MFVCAILISIQNTLEQLNDYLKDISSTLNRRAKVHTPIICEKQFKRHEAILDNLFVKVDQQHFMLKTKISIKQCKHGLKVTFSMISLYYVPKRVVKKAGPSLIEREEASLGKYKRG